MRFSNNAAQVIPVVIGMAGEKAWNGQQEKVVLMGRYYSL